MEILKLTRFEHNQSILPYYIPNIRQRPDIQQHPRRFSRNQSPKPRSSAFLSPEARTTPPGLAAYRYGLLLPASTSYTASRASIRCFLFLMHPVWARHPPSTIRIGVSVQKPQSPGKSYRTAYASVSVRFCFYHDASIDTADS